MNCIHRVFRVALGARRSPETESGLSLVEVIVAMMVFSIITVGFAYSITNSLVETRDSQNRETATNLASQTIDFDRALDDVFKVPVGTTDQVVGGVTYHIATSTYWVTSSADSASAVCGTGGGTLQYKQVTVRVTWDGQSAGGSPVYADTQIAPNSRVNDPALGTIVVSVKSASGAGLAGVPVTVTPNTSGLPTPTANGVTDSNGCAYVLKVTPGSYAVSITTTGGIDWKQFTKPTVTAPVVAGGSYSAAFSYDSSSAYTLKFAQGNSGPNPILPTNLNASFLSSVGGVYTPTSLTNPISLFPYSDGYSIVAGTYLPGTGTSSSCLSVNPAEWTTANSAGKTGQAVQKVAPTAPGSPVGNVKVGMGDVTVTGLTSGKYLTAVNAQGILGSGDPGCAASQTITFPQLTANSATIALPYGTWNIYQASTAGTTPLLGIIGGTNLKNETNGAVSALLNTVTLDPRPTS